MHTRDMNSKYKAKSFYNQFGAKLLRDFVNGNPRMEMAILSACNKLKQFQRKAVLDLGFGLGWSSFEFSRAVPDLNVLGIDLSPQLRDLASALFSENSRLQFECQDLCDSSWSEKFRSDYDACVMLDVYEHIPRSERSDFHAALASKLADDAIVILSCPTILHQSYLRDERPDALQPVDEDVTFKDLLILAHTLGGELIHLAYQSVWTSHDYFHAVISRKPLRRATTIMTMNHRLMSKRERLARLSLAKAIVGEHQVSAIKGKKPRLLRSIVRKIRAQIPI